MNITSMSYDLINNGSPKGIKGVITVPEGKSVLPSNGYINYNVSGIVQAQHVMNSRFRE